MSGISGAQRIAFFLTFVSFSALAPVFSGGLSAAGNTRPILFIMDASGSMAENFQGVPRIVAARVMLQEQLSRLDPSVPVGLVAYGNRIPGCTSSRLYNPISIGNRTGVMRNVNNMFPAGNTPLAATLNLVGKSIIQRHPETTVIVISDGAESCGGNPATEASILRSRGIDVQVHVIGMNVDRDTARQLADVAKSGKGDYFDVRNHTDFENAIKLSIEKATRPQAAVPAAQPRQAETADDLQLKLTGLRMKAKNDDSVTVEIDYEFKGGKKGDYHIEFMATPRPIKAGSKRLIPPQEASPPGRGLALYGKSDQKGRVELEIPLANLRGRPIYLQGELWDTSSVPERLGASNSLRYP